MTKQEYFGDWLKVIPEKEMQEAINKLNPIRDKICPDYKNIFRAFHLCPYNKLKLIIIGQDPYPQKDVATGLAFANTNNTEDKYLSPSLQIIKESVIDYGVPHNLITFAPGLEEWEEQGVLLLNTALTCEVNKPESHSLLWRPFIVKLLQNICSNNTGIVFLLLGGKAQSLKPYIDRFQYVYEAHHPSYYHRKHRKMPSVIWHNINNTIKGLYGNKIKFYKEYGS